MHEIIACTDMYGIPCLPSPFYCIVCSISKGFEQLVNTELLNTLKTFQSQLCPVHANTPLPQNSLSIAMVMSKVKPPIATDAYNARLNHSTLYDSSPKTVHLHLRINLQAWALSVVYQTEV